MTDASRAQLQRLADKEEIRELIGDYSEAADRGRPGDLAALFLAEGTLEVVGPSFDAGTYNGRAAIVDLLEGNTAKLRETQDTPLLRHHLATIRIRLLEENRARAESYFLALAEDGVDHWGRYSDRLSRGQEGWRFELRRVIHEGHAPQSWLRRQLDRDSD